MYCPTCTGPQALVIIIGNPAVLAADACWAELLRYAIEHNAYTGSAPRPTQPGGDGSSATRSGGANGAATLETASLDRVVDTLRRLVLEEERGHAREAEGELGADEGGVRLEGQPMRRVW